MDNYIDNVVIELKRQYSKDELVSHLLKKQSELEIEIGILKSEKDELQYKLRDTLKLDPEVKQVLQKKKLYRSLIIQIHSLDKKFRLLKIKNEKDFADFILSKK